MKAVRILGILGLALFLVSCASRSEIETMQSQLDYLYKSSSQTQENISRLDSLYKLTIEANVRYQADLKSQLAEMIDRMSVIDGRLTDIERQLRDIQDRNQSARTLRPEPMDTSGKNGTTSATTGLPTIDQNKMFDNAFTDLKSGNYDLAILQFEEFIRQFPDTPRTDDAQYWLAECHYGKRDYARAIIEFEKVEKSYKQSDKLGPSLFKLARSFEETGNKVKACAVFKRITVDFADSFEARQAGDKLKDLQCP